MIDPISAYRALTSRDARFDGVFYVGVISTGIYCRPVCPVKAPRAQNCLFFATAEAAEKASFRPCLRCRPELAPGNAPVDHGQRIAERLVQRIDEGLVEQVDSLEQIAAEFQLSLRQLRRIVKKELGVSPQELRQTRRLLLAKQLLSETQLAITHIAFACGFNSLRRFNAVFSSHYRMSPSRLRKVSAQRENLLKDIDTSRLLLTYRPPYDWQAMLTFLRQRALPGVEYVEENSYARTVCLGERRGWIQVTQVLLKNALQVEFSHSLTPVLSLLLRRLRNLFDLSARPDLIAQQLSLDPQLRPCLLAHPGLRVPGAFDGFEIAVSAILGQQITAGAAATLGFRFATAFGEAITTPLAQLSILSPLAERVAQCSIAELTRLGIGSSRSRAILALAANCARNELQLDVASQPEQSIGQLLQLPGVSEGTAQYLAMRALRWPDAFPEGDLVVRTKLGGLSAKQAQARCMAWRPWRSYAVMHLWLAED
ncbi:helix-turn-helix domain-containing protein [Erwinia amylovora]|uniref:AlkA N-terminal domain-containing protein n=1 Tax=Erwinia amylovora TaxID=552 RepID=UPI000C06EBA8|nr:AlkA N-terminal domain-containing protein [Erwinia amylovora]MBZ2399817.1 helix-turn-helix domain-containing protein [Erwinia amylovora]MBZ2403678.1 helix-turn-helix domain-containing protein [Erwinia amylovora]UDJ88475.1 helix-turn-helix domain-containing protein [Erwinia amylovora]UDK91280.1 helix-turn-helix domain-containing protein [Erwinia amylovora]UDK94676.1 helix-turn-helix domain-containing protein [Erwinia amylovora]